MKIFEIMLRQDIFLIGKAFIVAFLLGFNSCFSEVSDKNIQRASKLIEPIIIESMKKICVPGAGIAVVRGNKIVYQAYFGKNFQDFLEKDSQSRDIHKNQLLENDAVLSDSNTVFPLSSLTKTVTAILIAGLVDDGILSLDDKVRKYLPDFFIISEEVSTEFTIRDLVSHCSGLRHFSGDTVWSGGYSKQMIVNSIRHLKPSKVYRKDYGYQNVVFGIVGDIIEKATGKRYEDLIQKYVFDKMDMKNVSAIPLMYESNFFKYISYISKRFIDDCSDYGVGSGISMFFHKLFSFTSKKISRTHGIYDGDIEILPLCDFYHKLPATSGVAMSIPEFSKLMIMIKNRGVYSGKTVISSKSLDQITADTIKVEGLKDDNIVFPKDRVSNVFYGSGFFKADYGDNGKNKRRILFHMGGTYGSGTFFAVSEKDDIGVVVFCNYGGTAQTIFAELMTYQFLDLCFNFSKKDWVNIELDHRERAKQAKEAFYRDMREKNMTAKQKSEKYVGLYRSKMYGDIEITLSGGNLFVDNGIRKTRIDHLNGNIFTFNGKQMIPNYYDREEYVMFYEDNKGVFSSMYVSCFDEGDTMFNRVKIK